MNFWFYLLDKVYSLNEMNLKTDENSAITTVHLFNINILNEH